MSERPLTANQILDVRNQWIEFSKAFINHAARQLNVPPHVVHSAIEGLSPQRPVDAPELVIFNPPRQG